VSSVIHSLSHCSVILAILKIRVQSFLEVTLVILG
jgi:hypothetical protein